jgi:hypothetical protein
MKGSLFLRISKQKPRNANQKKPPKIHFLQILKSHPSLPPNQNFFIGVYLALSLSKGACRREFKI